MSSLLSSNSTSSPSYVCTSISAARELLILDIRHKVHSGHEIKVGEDPWIPTVPARPGNPYGLVLSSNLRVSDLINPDSKNWDIELLTNYVHPADIPLIRSLIISTTNHRDSFCWSYTKIGQYTVKSGYKVARHLLRKDNESLVCEPGITDLQAFVWKVKAPPKMHHLMWQLITGHVAVTRNLNYRNMRCDDICPRCGDPEETVTHAIFECPPALQVWALSSTPSGQNIFPLPGIFANMDYLFWRNEEFIASASHRDPYPWIIWYIWKARNDKIFRRIDRDPMELARFAESECLAWFSANDNIGQNPQVPCIAETQTICLENICIVDGSWTDADQYSGCGWVWKNDDGKIELMGTRNLRKRETALHSELKAFRWALECMLQYSSCQRFGTDCKDLIAMISDPQAWLRFATELEAIKTLMICFPEFEICHVPRAHNGVADALAKTARTFYRDLCFVGSSIPVWLPRPPQV